MLGQDGNILAALAQRRNGDPDDIEAIQQVEAEPAGGDLLTQIAVGRGDNAHVDPAGRFSPTRRSSPS